MDDKPAGQVRKEGGQKLLPHPSGLGALDITPHFGWPGYVEAAPGKPYGWVQWKGTRVCMDLHCRCGAHGHIDAQFAYFVKCLVCGRVYAVGQNILLYELSSELRPGPKSVSPIEFASTFTEVFAIREEEDRQ